jgi:hypothetical protein
MAKEHSKGYILVMLLFSEYPKVRCQIVPAIEVAGCFLKKRDIVAHIKNLDIFLMPLTVQEFGKLTFEVFM